MTERERRVINAFIACVKSRAFTLDYAVLIIEDDTRFGWLSEQAKTAFYRAIGEMDVDAEKSAST